MPSRIEAEATKYEAQLKATLKAGKLTNVQAKALVQEAKAGGFTEVKAFYLASFIANNGDKFEASAKTTLERFIGGRSLTKYAPIEAETGTTSTSAQPGLTADDVKQGGVGFAKAGGALVDGDISADDPLQGQLGDCYFISSMAAVANSRPELLQKAIKDNGNGTYTVTLWQHDDMDQAPRAVKITVDAKVPEKYGAPEYVSTRSGKELWPLLFEKAYAKWKGSYEDIEGGMGANALSALTGARPGYFPVTSDMKTDTVWNKLKTACAKGGCVVADSTAFGEQVSGVIGDHTYTVLGVEEKNGQKLVKLRNPWGEREPSGDGKDDGIFTLPIEKFVKAYAMVEFVKP
jgi:hypothetical protein